MATWLCVTACSGRVEIAEDAIPGAGSSSGGGASGGGDTVQGAATGTGGGPAESPPPCSVAAPVLLTQAAPGLSAMTIAAGHVYYGNGVDGTISRVALTGGPPALLVTDAYLVLGMSTDDLYLYWTIGGGGGPLMRVSLSGGAAEFLWNVSDGQPGDLVVDDGQIHLTITASTTVADGPRGLWRLSTDGTGAEQRYSGFVKRPVQLDETRAYFGDSTSQALVAVPQSGGAPTVIAPFTPQGDIQLDVDSIYWTMWEDEPQVWSASKASGSAQALATEDAGPLPGLAIVGSCIYWTSELHGTVRAMPKDGGAPVTVATDRPGVQRLATDGSSLVWLNAQTGALWRAEVLQ